MSNEKKSAIDIKALSQFLRSEAAQKKNSMEGFQGSDQIRRPYRGTDKLTAADWASGFSEPKPLMAAGEEFRYLVHGLMGRGARAVQHVDLIQKGAHNSDFNIDLLRNPKKVHKKPMVSCSIIDQDHRATFGEAGLILRAPFENVVDMAPNDIGSNFHDPGNALRDQRANGNIWPLSPLLRETSHTEHNEVLLEGETEDGKLEVIGFFIKVDKEGFPLDPETAKEIQVHARQTGLPVIELCKPLLSFPDTKAKLHRLIETEPPFGVGFSRDNVRYIVDFKEGDRAFKVLNDEGWQRSMTQEEARYSLGVIREELATGDFDSVSDELHLLEEQIQALPLEPDEQPKPHVDQIKDPMGETIFGTQKSRFEEGDFGKHFDRQAFDFGKLNITLKI